MNTQTCPDTNDTNSSRFAILYGLATGTIDLQTAKTLLPGGAEHRCEGQWGFEYGGDPRRCEESLFPLCEVKHLPVIMTMRGDAEYVIGIAYSPEILHAVEYLEEFLDIGEKIFDTSPVTRVAHYLWGRGRTQSEVQRSEYFMDLWRIRMANIFGTPECGWIDFNNSSKNNEVVS